MAHELVGDRRCAGAVAAEAVDPGGQDRERVEARVVPERLVLDRDLGVDDDRRDVRERDDLALLAAEPGQLDLVAVVDDRLLAEAQVLEGGRRGLEPDRVARERGHDPDGQEDREDREHRPDDERDPAGRRGGRSRRQLAARSALRAGGGVHVGLRGEGGSGGACHLAGDAAHERAAARCYDGVTTTGVAFQASNAARTVASTAGSTVPPARRSRPINAEPTTGGAARRTIHAPGIAAAIRTLRRRWA